MKHCYITRVTTNCHPIHIESLSGQCCVPSMTTLDLQVQIRPPAGVDMSRLSAALEAAMDQAIEDCIPYADGGEVE